MHIREEREELEARILSRRATLSSMSRGRLEEEPACPVRTCFQRDRDRIIHSKAFRRLKHKTQVFLIPEGDHFRTRLTHTLEVSQIARTISRALRLNEDLTEAIALGHDLGHTPFGHAGEEVLREIHPGGFNHNEQSLRVVDVLEKGEGLNLTWEVRDGILNHCGKHSPSTLEGKVVRIADRIAYVNHDIDDAIRGEILRQSDLPAECLDIIGYSHSKRIHRMIVDIITNSLDKPHIEMSDSMAESTEKLRTFLFERVYIGSSAKREEEKAKNMLKSLYNYYLKYPEEMYEGQGPPLGDLAQSVCDFIAGMTDRYSIIQFKKYFLPQPWVSLSDTM